MPVAAARREGGRRLPLAPSFPGSLGTTCLGRLRPPASAQPGPLWHPARPGLWCAQSGEPQKGDRGSWRQAETPTLPGPPRAQIPVLPPAGSQASGPADDLISTSGLADKAHFTDEDTETREE